MWRPHKPAILSEMTSFWLSDRPCLKAIRQGAMKGDIRQPILSLCMWTHGPAYLYTYMYTPHTLIPTTPYTHHHQQQQPPQNEKMNYADPLFSLTLLLYPHPIYQQPWEKCVSSDFWKPCTPCGPSFYSEVRRSFFLPGPFYVCSPCFLPRGLTKSVSSLQPEWYFNMVNLIMASPIIAILLGSPRAPEWKPNFLAWQTAPSWASPRPLCGPVLSPFWLQLALKPQHSGS